MVGLPASGKSTKAQEFVAQGNTVRLNKDLLRTMLHFDKWSGRNEGLTRDAARTLAQHFLAEGKTVIIDDTNLNEGTLQSWKDLAKDAKTKIQYERIDTPLSECLLRDRDREKPVGEHVIVGMAMQYDRYPKPEKPIVLCDLDGTLCNITHRLHHVKGEQKDWKAFFAGIVDDTVNQNVLDMVMEYEGNGHQIFFVSARPDQYRNMTEWWLERAFSGYKPYQALFMRKHGDMRPDTEVKKGMFEAYFSKLPIETVIDDRPSVIRMWRELGLKVIDVGSGEEF